MPPPANSQLRCGGSAPAAKLSISKNRSTLYRLWDRYLPPLLAVYCRNLIIKEKWFLVFLSRLATVNIFISPINWNLSFPTLRQLLFPLFNYFSNFFVNIHSSFLSFFRILSYYFKCEFNITSCHIILKKFPFILPTPILP